MVEALDASIAEETVDRAAASRDTVERSFTIQAMARALSSVYQGVHDEESESRGWSFAAL